MRFVFVSLSDGGAEESAANHVLLPRHGGDESFEMGDDHGGELHSGDAYHSLSIVSPVRGEITPWNISYYDLSQRNAQYICHFTMPQVSDGQRYVKGIPAVILDSASLNVMLQSIALPLDDDGKVIVQFYSGPDESVMADDTFMCKWQMTTTNAVQRGCRYEVSKNGMMKATFSAQNKLTFMEQTFDVMSFMQQLRRASGKFEFLVIEHTLFCVLA